MNSEALVVIDANALMAQPQFGVDLFDEIQGLVGAFRGVVPRTVVNELERLSESDSDAEIALELVERHYEVVDDSGDGGDNALIEVGLESDYAATNDKELMNRLTERGIPVLFLRQGSYLDINYP